MTEAEWLESEEPYPMLQFLRGRASDRKLRLFAVACCRRIWHLLRDERSKKAVEAAEGYADERNNRKQLIKARNEAREARQLPIGHFVAWRAASAAQDVTRDTGKSAALNCTAQASRAVHTQDTNHCDTGELHQQALVLRCLCGNPFRPVLLDPSWRTSTVTSLAQAIYDGRSYDRLPILADALEDAGCTNGDLLEHCRSSAEHVRGCFVLDLLLGKS